VNLMQPVNVDDVVKTLQERVDARRANGD